MARLVTTGFEVQSLEGSSQSGESGIRIEPGPATVQNVTTSPASGACCVECATSGENFVYAEVSTSLATSYYFRQATWFSSVSPSTNLAFMETVSLASGKALVSVVLNEAGEVIVIDRITSETVISTGFKPSKETWYYYELKDEVPVAGNGEIGLIIRSSTGTLLYESGNVTKSIGTSAIGLFAGGHISTETKVTVRVDDWAINDSTGEHQNSYPGFGKLVLLKPKSDKARTGWLGGGGATTNLYKGFNTPPKGKVVGSASETTQIKDATNNATDTYEANLSTYEQAVSEGGGGLESTAQVLLVMALVRIGNSTATSRNIGVKGVSNPAVTEVTKATLAKAAETETTGWTTGVSAPVYSPTVELGVSPVLQVRKATASTDSAMVDLIGLYVEYTPSTKTPAVVEPAAASGTSSPTLSIHAPTKAALGAAEGAATSSAQFTAATKVALSAASGTSETSLSVHAPAGIGLEESTGTSAPSLSLRALILIALGSSSGLSAPSVGIHAPTFVALQLATGTSEPSLFISRKAMLELQAAVSSSDPSLKVHVPIFVVLEAATGTSDPSAHVKIRQKPTLKLRYKGEWVNLDVHFV